MVRPALFNMGKIRELAAKARSITDDDINESILKVVDKNKSEALDLNLKQLFSGRDAKDQSLGRYHSQAYAEFKRSLNPAGVVDLKLTGDFYRGFFAKTDRFPIEFASTDSKTDMLEEKYGKEIFGLDQANLEEFRKEIKPDIGKLFRSFFHV